MLDPKTGPNLLAAQVAPLEAEGPSTAEMIANVLGVVRRQIVLVLALTFLGAALAAVFLLESEPQFVATTTLLINTHKIEIFQQPAVADELPLQAMGAVESQVELLRSDEVALRVIQKLDLAQDPRFVRENGIGKLLHALWPGYTPRSLSAADRQNWALRVIDSNLTVERIGVTYAIEIKYQSTDPQLAAEVATAVADAYTDLQRSSEYGAARRASDWLENRIPEMRAKREAAQKAVFDYKLEHNIVETGAGQLIEDQRLSDMNLKLNAARDETIKARERWSQFAALSGADLLSALTGGKKGDGVASEALTKLRDRYFEVSSKLAESSSNLGANNPAIVSLRNQQAQLRSETADEVQRLKQSAESDYAAAQLREANVRKEFDAAVAQAQGAKAAQVKLQELEASAHAYQDLYGTYVSRYNASLQQAASPVAEATVITPANSLIQRNYKKTIEMAALFPLAGLMLGLGIAILREMLADRVLLTSKSVQSRLRLACIGILPKAHTGRRIGWRLKGARTAEPRTVVHGDRGICWTVVEKPFSQFAEGVRSIKFAIDLENRSRASRVIGVTSSLANEGKSTVALAMAQMIASNGSTAILVDCDLRNPSLTRSIAPGAEAGIVELAYGRIALEEAIWKDPSTQMAFLPAIPAAAPPIRPRFWPARK